MSEELKDFESLVFKTVDRRMYSFIVRNILMFFDETKFVWINKFESLMLNEGFYELSYKGYYK